jgi:hypothetical protein
LFEFDISSFVFSLAHSLVDYTFHDSHVIFLAARYGHVAFMRFLFELPRIDIVSENALIPACEFGHFEIVRMLWERGLDPSRYAVF